MSSGKALFHIYYFSWHGGLSCVPLLQNLYFGTGQNVDMISFEGSRGYTYEQLEDENLLPVTG